MYIYMYVHVYMYERNGRIHVSIHIYIQICICILRNLGCILFVNILRISCWSLYIHTCLTPPVVYSIRLNYT